MSKVETNAKVEIVKAGVEAFEAPEMLLQDAIQSMAKLNDIFDAGNNAGMVGRGEHLEMKAEVIEIQGDIGKALRKLAQLHMRCTKIAQKHGVDIPDPKNLGCMQCEVVVLGGGSR